jgi:sulfur-oxidizing protein SoxX
MNPDAMKRTLLLLAVVLGACSSTPQRHFADEKDLGEVQAALKRDFHARGAAQMTRLEADAVQQACNLYDNEPPEPVAKKLEAEQFAKIPFPQGSLIGNWKSGQRIAQSGRGGQWNDGPKDPTGGSCYNCHQLSAAEPSFGTIGPSLNGFGKLRGNSADMQKYAYGRIYNSKAYNLCSQMPRLGHSGTLGEQQIKDLVAYLLDPESPVNK